MMSKEDRQMMKRVRESLRQHPQLREIMNEYQTLSEQSKDVFAREVYKLLREKTMN